jgi:hypothetical protein
MGTLVSTHTIDRYGDRHPPHATRRIRVDLPSLRDLPLSQHVRATTRRVPW